MEINLSHYVFLAFLLHFSTLPFVNAEVPDISTDKQALLSLKARISHDPSNLLAGNWSRRASVCDWIGITCGVRHHRVTALNISYLNLTATLPPQLGNLSFLVILSIKNNSFYGSIPEELAHLRRLKYLQFTFNNFSNLKIPSWFGSLTKLQHLGLSEVKFSGTIPQSLGNLSSLQQLFLDYNELSGPIPTSIFNISSLQVLSLYQNQLSGSFPFIPFNMASLIYIDLGENGFSGGVSASFFDYLPNLERLFLDKNFLNSEIPSTLSKCKGLQALFLDKNNFTGSIPKEIGNLTQLEHLGLAYNKLQGEIPYEFGNLRNLESLHLEFNSLVGPVPATVFNISTMELLSVLGNELTGILPSTAELPNLEELYLGINNFSGPFPGFITNASKLSVLEMGSNSFSGIIPRAVGNLRNLQWLALNKNYFTSSTPDLSLISPLANCKHLSHLDLYGNPLNSILPSSIGNLSISLESLDMTECNISGNIPKEIGNLNNLIDLQLEDNELTGSVPVTLGGLQKLQGLNLEYNELEGFIPNSLCQLNELVELQLGGNKIYGYIPSCLGNLTALRKLSLGFNKLTSFIPSTLWNLKDILYFDLSSNSLKGSLPLEIGNLKVAVNIDFSRNILSGDIPIVIGSLENLQNLSLAFNRLQGSIPETFGHLRSLEFFDLSSNNLSGVIPKSLETLFYLKYLNLSFNQLSGEIPKGGSFGNFSTESFMGNLALCGSSRLHVPPCKTSTHGKSSSRKVLLFIVLPLSITFTVVVFVLIFVLMKCRKKRTRPPTHVEMHPQRAWRRISYEELVRATNGFSENNLLGRGSYGSVFRGRLHDGMELAVKVFHLHFEEALTSFEAECAVMSNIRHRNLIKIISSCSNDDFKSLILEYMPNGSLEKCLYSNNNVLDISQRLNIMIDVASALEYLHFGYSVPIIHCDLKPSNVLLDENMVAHLSDFGIAKLLGEDSMKQTQTLATIGYMAPEYGREGKISRQGDVYSYGIMLMETFTRKKPTNEIFTEGMSLRSWVGESLCRTIMEVVDTNLLRMDDEHFSSKEECVSSILSLAMECTRESTLERINIKEAVTRLLKIRVEFAKIGSRRGRSSSSKLERNG